MAPPAKKRKCSGKLSKDWIRLFGGCIVESKLGEQYARCILCSRDVKVSASGVYDVKEHIRSKVHQTNEELRDKHATVKAFFKPSTSAVTASSNATKAEILFSYFVAEHNLPASASDHFTDLVHTMFPDSAIAKSFKCKRTKMTQIMKRCLATTSTKAVIDHCRTAPFSLMVDESNDKKSDKRLGMLVRFFDSAIGRSVTRLLDLPVCNNGKAEDIFGVINETLR